MCCSKGFSELRLVEVESIVYLGGLTETSGSGENYWIGVVFVLLNWGRGGTNSSRMTYVGGF